MVDRIASRRADGTVFEVHTVPIRSNPFAYGSRLAEIDRRQRNPVATYEVISPHGEIFVACTTPGRWFELIERWAS
jgi:hypothetical protein